MSLDFSWHAKALLSGLAASHGNEIYKEISKKYVAWVGPRRTFLRRQMASVR